MYHIFSVLILAILLLPLQVLAQESVGNDEPSLEGYGAEELPLYTPIEHHLKTLESYVGLPLGEIRQLLGEPMHTEVEAKGIPEREALIWLYDVELTDSNRVQWCVASQYDRIIGVQVVTIQDAEKIINGTYKFIEEVGTTIGLSGPFTPHPRYITRRSDLLWSFGLTEIEAREAALIRIGTVKYSTCDLNWDGEKLRGTDGFGNPLPQQ